MPRGPKPAKSKKARPTVARKSPKDNGSRGSDLAKRLAEALRDKAEAQEQQKATAEILHVIGSSPTDVQPVFEVIGDSALRLCRAWSTSVWRLEDGVLRVVSAHGGTPGSIRLMLERPPMPSDSAGLWTRVIAERRVFEIVDVEADARIGESTRELARARGWRARLDVPMVRGQETVGLISVTHAEPGPFASAHTELLKTFADQAVIAIENVRLFKELQEKNRALTQAHAQVTEALEQQTATSEILQVISGSPTNIQPVFDTIVQSAARLCDGMFAALHRFDGELLYWVAQHNFTVEGLALMRKRYPMRPIRETSVGRAVIDRTVIHISDFESNPYSPPSSREIARAFGYRSQITVPMLREGQPVGAISVARQDGPFSQAQIKLLQTFADQAVIAIENVRLFKELEAANRELAAASQHKSEFLANMSHELRTPLNAIIGFSEVLTDRMFGELNEKQEEYLKDIYASGTHLLSLINDILDLSKIEAGRMELELTEFDLPTAIENALMLVRERVGRRSIALHTNIDDRLGQIQADERKVRQVVLNLLSNAIKFTPEGGRIEVGAVSKDGSVEISVSDTGIGIAPEDQEKVFEEFRQVGAAAKKVEGTGLGLTLCRKFVELHGGRIWVKSQEGVGSTFAFTLPMHRSE